MDTPFEHETEPNSGDAGGGSRRRWTFDRPTGEIREFLATEDFPLRDLTDREVGAVAGAGAPTVPIPRRP